MGKLSNAQMINLMRHRVNEFNSAFMRLFRHPAKTMAVSVSEVLDLCDRLEASDAKLAELGKMDLYTFKPIVWKEIEPGVHNARIGDFFDLQVQVAQEWVSWYALYDDSTLMDDIENTLEEAKRAAEKYFRTFISSALVEV